MTQNMNTFIIYGIIAIVHIKRVNAQNQCNRFACPNLAGCAGEPAVSFTCDESNPLIGGEPCVEYTDRCSACSRACLLGQALAPAIDQNTVYGFLNCGTGICPTPAPTITGASRAPTGSPTLSPVCSAFDCANGCSGQPADPYYCDTGGLNGYVCSNQPDQCSACCEAEIMAASAIPTQHAYDNWCDNPGVCPTSSPSKAPSAEPSSPPSTPPSTVPSGSPTTSAPSSSPSFNPSKSPSQTPTTGQPTQPTSAPVTAQPTAATEPPTFDPTIEPTTSAPSTDPPSSPPTLDPTTEPTVDPTSDPTTNSPTSEPTTNPTDNPASEPTTTSPTTGTPTSAAPTSALPTTNAPTLIPTNEPTINPTTASPTTMSPTFEPTSDPSSSPITVSPTTLVPTTQPTSMPTNNPTNQPSINPQPIEAQQKLQALTLYYQIFAGTLGVMVILAALAALIDARCIRANDYFRVGAILSTLIQTADMISDCVFIASIDIVHSVNVNMKYKILFYLSIFFVAFPTLISLLQLYMHTKKHWLKDSRLASWIRK